jgi:hypothetical protein
VTPAAMGFAPGTNVRYGDAQVNKGRGFTQKHFKPPPWFKYGLQPGSDYNERAAQVGVAEQERRAAEAQANAQRAAAAAQARAQAIIGNQQGMAGIGQSQANLYQFLAGGMGNLANAQAMERGNWAAANAQAEAARQAALGNMANQQLASAGGVGNTALSAWALNQQAFNQNMAAQQAANQQAISGYGASRNQALGGLGNAYVGLDRNQVLGGILGGQQGGGDFRATGPGGPIADGSYYPGTSPGGGGMGGDRGGLDGLRQDIMSGDIRDLMAREAEEGRRSSMDQHMSSRGQPGQMMQAALAGLLQMGREGYGAAGRGMDQFYQTQNDPQNRMDFSPFFQALMQGFDGSRGDVNTTRDQMNDLMRQYLGFNQPTMYANARV